MEALKKTCPYDFDLEFVFIYEDADKCKYSEVCERIFSMFKQEGEIDRNETKIKIPTTVKTIILDVNEQQNATVNETIDKNMRDVEDIVICEIQFIMVEVVITNLL